MERTVVAVGEVLWDLLPEGRRLGGAAANIACAVRSMGGKSALVSAVGSDPLGAEIEAELSSRGVDISALARLADKPTGTVDVTMDEDRNHTFTIVEDVAWDNIPVSQAARGICASAAALCFDSLTQRSEYGRRSITELIRSTGKDCTKIFDINLRQNFFCRDVIQSSFELADIVKVNDDEQIIVAEMFDLPKDDFKKFAIALTERFKLKASVITLGPDGVIGSVCGAEGAFHCKPAMEITVADTIGAGDGFVAALAMGLLGGKDFKAACRAAVNFAAHICTISGAVIGADYDASGFLA